MAPFIMSKDMAKRIPYRSKLEFSHVATLQILGLNKKIDKFAI